MSDQRFGGLVRAVRIRLRWRQSDLAARASVSQTSVSRLERGHLGSLSLDTIRRIGAALDIRVDLIGRWRGGDLDRLLNARHSALSELVVRALRRPGWLIAPEVSFSIYGDRGVIDLLAWNPELRSLLVIELKTEIVDVNELVGTFDRKVRLAIQIARDHGWKVPANTTVSAWLIAAESRTNRRRVHAHAAMLRAAYPLDGRGIRRWLGTPHEAVRCLSFWQSSKASGRTVVQRRIRHARPPPEPATPALRIDNKRTERPVSRGGSAA